MDFKDLRLVAIDDDEMTLMMLKNIFAEEGQISCFTSGQTALNFLEHHVPDLILLDYYLPDFTGFEILHLIRNEPLLNKVPVIILTGELESSLEADGFKAGATDFIRKPVIGDVVYDRVHRILEYEHLQKNLSWEVKRKTEQVEQLLSESQLLFREMATALAQAIDAKDKYTRGHSERVALYAKEIARRSGESEDDQLKVYYMGLFHDIGKIGVPRNILNKPGSLTEDEYKLIQSHSEIGYNILASIKVFPELAQGARFHHERFDGCGYPLGLKGEAIPKFARILSIADSYDAMTSKRSYRNSLPQATVRAEVAKGRGKQFDPRFADIMLAIIDADPNYELREKE